MKGSRKRGSSFAVNLIIAVAIALFAMIIIIFLYRKVPDWIHNSTDCEKNQGRCMDSGICAAGEMRTYEFQCKSQSQTCCRPTDLAHASLETSRFSTAEREALQNPIFMTIDKNPTPITEFNLKEGTSYDITLKFNDKLPEKSFGPVILYATEKSNPKKTYFIGLNSMEERNSPYVCKVTGENPECSISKEIKWPFKPSLQDSFKSYTYHVLVLDSEKIDCQPLKSNQEKYNTCLTDRKKLSAEDKANLKDYKTLTDEQILALIKDQDYRLAYKTYPIKVTRILEVSGVSTQWVAENTVTLTVSDPEYDRVGLALVNAADVSTGLDGVVAKCTNLMSESDFVYSVTNIVGTTLETKGIDLGLNIGGFRIPTSSTKLKYLVQSNNIKLVNKKASVKIDKATILKDFYEKTKDDSMLIGENAWLCARATKSKDNTAAAYAVSLSSIKVDVIPPEVSQESVKIVYPDPITTTPSYSTQYPSISGTNYFYKQYPQVVIACQDYGQSGCANYDYYLQTGNFVNVNVQGDSIGDAITGVALQVGLNQLFEYFAKKDPYNTICPPIYSSSEFRMNTRPTIKLRTEGQGIICIRVRDRVGNQVMVWKELLTPQELMKRIAVEEANKEINEALAGALT
jgi:hypothetical protein